MASSRIYAVKHGDTMRLVRASHPNTALMHVARGEHSVRVATQTDLENAFKAGIKVEEPGQAPEQAGKQQVVA